MPGPPGPLPSPSPRRPLLPRPQSGKVPAEVVREAFEDVFGWEHEAVEAFAELCDTLPSDDRRAALMGSAGIRRTRKGGVAPAQAVPRASDRPVLASSGPAGGPAPAPAGAPVAPRPGPRPGRPVASPAPGTAAGVAEPRRVVSLRGQGRPPPPGRAAPAAEHHGVVPSGGWGRNVVWLVRRDMRVHDNAALARAGALAQREGSRVTVCYIDAPGEDGADPTSDMAAEWAGDGGRGGHAGAAPGVRAEDLEALGVPARAARAWRGGGVRSWAPGGASRVWQREGLRELDRTLRKRYGDGAGVVYLRGGYVPALLGLMEATGSGHVVMSRRYEPSEVAADARIAGALAPRGVGVHVEGTLLLREPWEVSVEPGRNKMGQFGHFGTLTPFLRECYALGFPDAPVAPPRSLPVAPGDVAGRLGCTLEELDMVPLPQWERPDGRREEVDWVSQILRSWPSGFGEVAALAALDRFLMEGLRRYEKERGYADGRAVARLSPYLHFGQLSPRLMVRKLTQARAPDVSKTFWRRLVWRDLAYWQLWHWPWMGDRPIRPAYARQEWRGGEGEVAAWQTGATGYPLVDAGMRELWVTGWMQQNVRMSAACFLVEVLGCDWRHGAQWFHDNLCDADVAINSMMWQNAGKSGLDQWNFTVGPGSAAARSLDPEGDYVRRWVPELARLPTRYLHEPWTAPPAVLREAGVELGVTYPARVAGLSSPQDLEAARRAHVRAVRAARSRADARDVDGGGYDCIPCPEGTCKPGTDAARTGRVRVYTAPPVRGRREEMFSEPSRGAAGAGGAGRPAGGGRGGGGAGSVSGGPRGNGGQRVSDGGGRKRGRGGSPPGAGKARGGKAKPRERLQGLDKMDSMQRTLDEYVRRGKVDSRVDDEMI